MLTDPSPKKLFLLDGVGALISAFFLGVVLVYWKELIGVPLDTLYFLAALPCFFALYDFYHFFRTKIEQGKFLLGIILANSLYCILSAALLVYHKNSLTVLGWTYFTLELFILFALIYLEYKTWKKYRNKY